jgi:hypothetical protein
MCIIYKILFNMKGTTKYIKTGIFCSRLKGVEIGILKPWPEGEGGSIFFLCI